VAYLHEKGMHLRGGERGFLAFRNTVDREAYSMPYRSFRVLLDINSDKATVLEIQVTKKMH
jgi:hypothetical protein